MPARSSSKTSKGKACLFCLVLSREWGNGLWRLLLGNYYWGVYRDYYSLSTREKLEGRLVVPVKTGNRCFMWRCASKHEGSGQVHTL